MPTVFQTFRILDMAEAFACYCKDGHGGYDHSRDVNLVERHDEVRR
jgi:hypothetical protein